MNLPDSGDRTEFSTGAVRDASVGKGLPSHIPPIAIRKLAKHFEDGSRKYEPLNWMKGIPLSKYYDSAMRHLLAWSEGDDTEPHDAAILWNISCAMWTLDQINKGELPSELSDLPYSKNP